MRTIHNYTLRQESIDNQHKAGRYNPATEIHYRWAKGKVVYTLSCGNDDDLHIAREGKFLFVLTVNYRLPYCGIEVFSLVDNDNCPASVFLQGSEQIQEILGKRGLDYTPLTMIKIMREYCE